MVFSIKSPTAYVGAQESLLLCFPVISSDVTTVNPVSLNGWNFKETAVVSIIRLIAKEALKSN